MTAAGYEGIEGRRRQSLKGRLLNAALVRRLDAEGVMYSSAPLMRGRALVNRCPGSTISLGDDCELVSNNRWSALGVERPTIIRTLTPEATIEIGNHVGMTSAAIVAVIGVEIGDGCLLGADVLVTDSDFHEVHAERRRYLPMPRPKEEHRISIGPNVFLGTRAVILKGVSIGANSVIGAGAVVTRDVPANSIVAGNPASIVAAVRV